MTSQDPSQVALKHLSAAMGEALSGKASVNNIECGGLPIKRKG